MSTVHPAIFLRQVHQREIRDGPSSLNHESISQKSLWSSACQLSHHHTEGQYFSLQSCHQQWAPVLELQMLYWSYVTHCKSQSRENMKGGEVWEIEELMKNFWEIKERTKTSALFKSRSPIVGIILEHSPHSSSSSSPKLRCSCATPSIDSSRIKYQSHDLLPWKHQIPHHYAYGWIERHSA